MSVELSAVILTDLIFIELNRRDVLVSQKLKEWYKKYGILAVMSDVAIIWLVFFGVKYFTGLTGISLLLAILAAQIAHDFAFYVAFRAIPQGSSESMDFFKEYANEIGVKAVIGDSMMMVCAFVIHWLLSMAVTNSSLQMLLLGVSIYLVPYFLIG